MSASNTSYFRFFLLLAVALCFLASASTALAAAVWTPTTPGYGKFYQGVEYLDAQNGWLVGEDQIVLRTSDGGATFTQQHLDESAGWDLHKIQMLDVNAGWTVGNAGYIFHTVNGGATWSLQESPTNGPLMDLCMLSASEGWIVGPSSHLYYTANGGADPDGPGGATGWTLRSVGVPTGVDDIWFNGVDFPDGQHGWAVGEDYYPDPNPDAPYYARIFATSNGGASWSSQLPARTSVQGYFNDVDFVDAAQGWACGYNYEAPSGQRGLMYHTGDGLSWKAQSLPADVDELYGVHFVSASTGWAVGDDVILSTTNGGATWTKESSTDRYSGILTDVDFIDGTHGWASGYGDRLMRRGEGPVPKPAITALRPTSARRGALVAISGMGFGAARSTSAVKFGTVACTKYVSWSATRITCRVPAKAKYGTVKVTVTSTAGKSNAMSFTVKR